MPRPPLTVYALGLVAATVALLAGGWLLLAPFALGYQPDGADWADATVADFVAGLVLLGLGVIALAAFAASFAARLRPARATVPATPAGAPAQDQELVALLRPLLAALDEPASATNSISAGRS